MDLALLVISAKARDTTALTFMALSALEASAWTSYLGNSTQAPTGSLAVARLPLILHSPLQKAAQGAEDTQARSSRAWGQRLGLIGLLPSHTAHLRESQAGKGQPTFRVAIGDSGCILTSNHSVSSTSDTCFSKIRSVLGSK